MCIFATKSHARAYAKGDLTEKQIRVLDMVSSKEHSNKFLVNYSQKI